MSPCTPGRWADTGTSTDTVHGDDFVGRTKGTEKYVRHHQSMAAPSSPSLSSVSETPELGPDGPRGLRMLATGMYVAGIGLLLYTWLREMMEPSPSGGCACAPEEHPSHGQAEAQVQMAMLQQQRATLEPMVVMLGRMQEQQQRLIEHVDVLERRVRSPGRRVVTIQEPAPEGAAAAQAPVETDGAPEEAELEAEDWS